MQTDLGNDGAHAFGMAEAPVKMEDSVNFILNQVCTSQSPLNFIKSWTWLMANIQIDNATRGTTGGKFPSYDGGEIVW